MKLSGIPARALAAAAALPTNAAARALLVTAAGEEVPPAEQPVPGPDAREKEVQREVKKLLSRRGCAVYDTSQPRASKVTPGLPDLVVFDRFRGLIFIEVKAPGGKPSPEQVRFRELCAGFGVNHVMGGVLEVRDFFLARADENEVEG